MLKNTSLTTEKTLTLFGILTLVVLTFLLSQKFKVNSYQPTFAKDTNEISQFPSEESQKSYEELIKNEGWVGSEQ